MENQADTLSSGSNSERDLPLHNIPLHPFLFALYAIGSLLAFNLQEIEVSQAYRSVLFSILLVVATLGAFFLLIRNWKKAAALTSLIIILFFSYGHVYGLIKNAEIAGMILGRHRF
jgi:tryptophan-rich sensory protein